MEKIKVYDVDAFMKEDINMSAFHYAKAAIFKGPNGVIFAEHEAIHQVENLITDSIMLDLTPISQPGKRYIMPTHQAAVPLKEIEEKAPCKEMTMEEFFDRKDYNWRCRQNFSTLLASMREIGLEPKEYLMEKTPLDKQINNAAAEKNAGVEIDKVSPVKAQER